MALPTRLKIDIFLNNLLGLWCDRIKTNFWLHYRSFSHSSIIKKFKECNRMQKSYKFDRAQNVIRNPIFY